jgi:transposase InsO family protein
MKLHANARTCPKSRRLLVDRIGREGWSVMEAAEAAGISDRTARRWLARWRAEGQAGLLDRSSAPRRIPHKTAPDRVSAICALRRLRLTAAEISEQLGMALSTVSAVLLREGLGKRSRLEPPEPVNRYERSSPGELIHIDVKKLGRITNGPGHRITGSRKNNRRTTYTRDGRRIGDAGWEFVHVCVDDFSRLAYAEVLTDERATTAVEFLERAVALYAQHGITVQRLMTDNGAACRSHAHALACRQLGIRHLTTQPYRPRTNGKAERFIQTLTRRRAHGRAYQTSNQRTTALSPWLLHYNFTRPHSSLSHKPPGSRLTNAPGNYSYPSSVQPPGTFVRVSDLGRSPLDARTEHGGGSRERCLLRR